MVMKNKLKIPLWALIGIVIPIIIGASYLEVLWLDWIIHSILDKDINRWILFAIIALIGIITPKKLVGLPLIVFVLSTIYIWIIL